MQLILKTFEPIKLHRGVEELPPQKNSREEERRKIWERG